MKNYTRHHLLPRSMGGKDDEDNIVMLPENVHNAWHLLFANKPPEKVAEIINKWFIPKDWEFIARKRED